MNDLKQFVAAALTGILSNQGLCNALSQEHKDKNIKSIQAGAAALALEMGKAALEAVKAEEK